jgi:hypothetical protein
VIRKNVRPKGTGSRYQFRIAAAGPDVDLGPMMNGMPGTSAGGLCWRQVRAWGEGARGVLAVTPDECFNLCGAKHRRVNRFAWEESV